MIKNYLIPNQYTRFPSKTMRVFRDIRMAMSIPTHGILRHCLVNLVDVLKGLPFQSKATQLLPPQLDEVQPTAVF